MEQKPSRARWAVPLGVLVAVFAAAAAQRARMPPDAIYGARESSLVQVGQAVLLGLACLLCLWVMIRSGRRRADFYWWLAPAFICFFMCWRELEIEEPYMGENAFTWKYLWGAGHLPYWKRIVLGVPSLTLSVAVLVACLKRVRLLVATLKRRDLRVGLALFALGIGLYFVAQVYDKSHTLLEEHGIRLPGVRGHRDEFWEEVIELAGAAAVLMGVLDHLRRRPIIAGALREAEATLLGQERALTSGCPVYTRLDSVAAGRDAVPAGAAKKNAQQKGSGDAALPDATDPG